MEEAQKKSRANVVLVAGILFNLSISVLYSWSVIKSNLIAPVVEGGFGWASSQAGLPYTVAIVFFAVGVLVGGLIQDKIGPRKVVTTGGALVGIGLILSSFAGSNFVVMCLTFGVVVGTGTGLGYGCVSPAALKWFHPSKKGLISGLVVGGFGIAAVYLAPLCQVLIGNFGASTTFMIIGIEALVVSVIAAQFIQNPPVGYVAEMPKNFTAASGVSSGVSVDRTWREMIKTKEFYLMFAMYALGSTVGLMVIGNITKIAKIQDPLTAVGYAALLVSLLAAFNAGGRIVGGMMSDKIGRPNTMLIAFVLQGVNMVLFSFYTSLPLFVVGCLLTGFCYGTLLSVFPSATADLFGLKNYGTNYGIVYLGWGLSGIIAPVLADIIFDSTGSFSLTYVMCAGICVLCVILGLFFRKMVLRKNQSQAFQEELPLASAAIPAQD